MPTFTYNGSFTNTLVLDGASGFDTLDFNGFPNVWGTSSDTLFDLTGITSFIGNAVFNLQDGDNTFLGSGLAEEILSFSGNDTILSGGGNDTIDAQGGADSIDAGNGDDLIMIGQSDGIVDFIQGGIGTDTVQLSWSQLEGLMLGVAASVEILDVSNAIFSPGEPGFIDGTSGRDEFDISGIQSISDPVTFYLGQSADTFIGSVLSDSVEAGSGNDSIDGGHGADSLNGSGGDDLLIGGRGNDTILGGEGYDIIRGGKGDDLIVLDYDVTQDDISGGAGTDTLEYQGSDLDGLILDAAASVEIFDASFGATVRGTTDDNVFDLSGVQTYTGFTSFDLSSGADEFIGSNQAEFVEGGAGADTVNGNGGQDIVYGASGRDLIKGGSGADSLDGGYGNDVLVGGSGADTMIGSAGRDTLNGQGGTDLIEGGDGNDNINGGNGADTILGQTGHDRLTGGGGADVFRFEYNWGDDTITDFDANDAEQIDLMQAFDITDFADLIANHLRDNGGDAEIYTFDSTILLEGISVSDIGIGLAYSADDFVF